jgi:ATP-independent RNA helicase DbpA
MREPITVKVDAVHAGGQIEQRWYEVKDSERLHTVSLLLNHFRPASTLAFCNTKAQCRDLAEVLKAQGFSALALFGELEQRERDQVLVQFANRSCSVLVATDVAARGPGHRQPGRRHQRGRDARHRSPRAPHRPHRARGRDRAGAEPGQHEGDGLCRQDRAVAGPRIRVAQARRADAHRNGPLVPPMVTLHIQGGRKEKIRPGDVLGALTADLGYTREQVGKINVNEWSTYVAVDRAIAARRRAAPERRAHQGQECEGARAGRVKTADVPGFQAFLAISHHQMVIVCY